MRLRFIYLLVFIVLLMFSCSRHNSSGVASSSGQRQHFSYQIERSLPQESEKSSRAPAITVLKGSASLLSTAKQAPPAMPKTNSGVIEKNRKVSPYAQPGELKMQKRIGPLNIKKDNVFFKIGSAVLAVGLVVLGLFGGIFISISSSGGVFFLGGLLIGLAVCLLSLPFFLLGIITEFMKRNSQPVENPNEI